jgi:hypothetical protein
VIIQLRGELWPAGLRLFETQARAKLEELATPSG